MLDLAGRFVVALWHVVGLLLIFILFVEFAPNAWRRASWWLRYRRGNRPDSAALADAQGNADWAVGYFNEFGRAVRVDWRAYVGRWQRPYRGVYVTLDERGLRPTPGEERRDAGTVRILCFGGSTMMGMGARDDRTIPAILAARLGELGHRVALTNYGQLGHNSTQELITLQGLLRAPTMWPRQSRPAVPALCGTNNGAAPSSTCCWMSVDATCSSPRCSPPYRGR